MTGIGIVNLIYARQLLNWSVCASVMMNEIAASYDDFVSQPLNDAKLHKGQQKIAEMMRVWMSDSKCISRERMNCTDRNMKKRFLNIKYSLIIR